jgi:predicted MFS family arabinose efflux permease
MPWQNRDGRVVGTAFMLHATLVGTWAGRVPAIKHALGLSDTALGAALFGMAAGTLLGSWWGGRLARRLGPATVVRGGLPAMAAALVASAFAGDLAALFVALACFGTLGAIVDVAMNTIAVAVERDRRRPLMSGFHGAWSAGLLLGALGASAAAAAGLAPRAHFSIVAIVVAGAAVTVLAALPRPPSPARAGRPGRTPWSAELVVLGAIAFCSFFAEGAAADWSAVYLHDRAGAGPALAAAAFAGFSVAMTASRLSGDRIVAAVGPVALARRAALTAACGLGLALAVPVPGAGIAGFALMGAGLAPIVPLVLSAAGAAAHGVEEALSRVLLIAYTGSIVGPAAIGFAAGRVELRAALLIPLALIVCIVLTAGRIEPAPSGELART